MGGLWRLPKDASCRGLGLLVVVAAVLAVFAVPGLWRPVALASSSPVLNWTQQHPATSPPARGQASMAYDAATGTVVLFSGVNGDGLKMFGDTWTWDGSTWAKQHPATSPPARYGASMAYDNATGTVVLFGGVNSDATGVTEDTWTWGSNPRPTV